MQQRGQVTVYVIIGLIIAALLITFYSYKGSLLFSKEEAAAVPSQIQDLNSQITNCLESVAEEGLVLAGLQGGYINRVSEIPVSGSNLFSNSLSLPGDLRVAYWYYETANGLKRSAVPSKNDIEVQIADYIDAHLPECTQSVVDYYNADVELGNPLTTVNILDDRVEIATRYKVFVKKGDFEFSLQNFNTQINAKFGKMYDAARKIMQAENEESYLEEKTIDILAMYDNIPFSDTRFECSTKIWTKPAVKESLKKALIVNIPKIKIKGAENARGEEYYRWDAGRISEGISVRFDYRKGWPVFMDVFPSEGNILIADQLGRNIGNRALAFLTSLFCVTNYNFVYDIKYPVLVTLTDDNGYVFQFATQVIVDNNQPKENILGAFEPVEVEKKICESASVPMTITVMAEQPGGGMEPVSGAEVFFKCINEVCHAGRTKKSKSGTRLFTLLPACVNGLLTARKEGYYEGKEIIDSNEAGSAVVVMHKIYPLKMDIKVLENGEERSLNPDETAIIYLEEKDKKYFASATQQQKEIKLIPGKYSVKSTLISQSPFEISIKGKEVTKCISRPRGLLGIFGLEEKKCTSSNIPDMKLNSIITGGGETEWEVQLDDLNSASEVTFYINANELPSNYEDLEKIYESIETQPMPQPVLT